MRVLWVLFLKVLSFFFRFCPFPFGFCPWGPILCPCPVHSLVDIFEFLLRKKGWVEL